jgi:glycerate kinase
VPSYLLHLGSRAGVGVALVAGLIEAPTGAFAEAVSLTELAGSGEAARADAERWLIAAGTELAHRFTASAP